MSDFIRKMTTFSLLLFTGFCFLKAGAGLVSGDSDLSLTEVEAAVPARIAEPQLQTACGCWGGIRIDGIRSL